MADREPAVKELLVVGETALLEALLLSRISKLDEVLELHSMMDAPVDLFTGASAVVFRNDGRWGALLTMRCG